MDAAEPPRIVFEQPAPCADGSRAKDALERALAPSRAPKAAWTVRLRVEKAPGSTLRGEGEITDADGLLVAERTIDTGSTECTSLARAVGVWASLVLDDEIQRESRASEPPPPPPTPTVTAWPAPAHAEKPSPESQLFLQHPADQRSFEVGIATHYLAGTGAGAIAGASIFTVSEVAEGWLLRPAISVGRSTSELVASSDVYATWGAARFDACRRLPGNYLERRGIQLDLCGGGDLGFMHFDAPTPPAWSPTLPPSGARTTPFFAIGPSFALRGELGNDLALWIRGIAELNIVRESFVDSAGSNVDPDLLISRAEVGVSWRLR